MKGDPFYELRSYYPQIGDSYAFLTGIAASGPIVLLSALAGRITDENNRVRLLGLATILWSLATLGGAEIDNFGLFCILRVSFGAITTISNPASLSLTRDYFPKDK